MDSSSDSSVASSGARRQYAAPTLTALGVTQGTSSGNQPKTFEFVSCTGYYFTSSGPN